MDDKRTPTPLKDAFGEVQKIGGSLLGLSQDRNTRRLDRLLNLQEDRELTNRLIQSLRNPSEQLTQEHLQQAMQASLQLAIDSAYQVNASPRSQNRINDDPQSVYDLGTTLQAADRLYHDQLRQNPELVHSAIREVAARHLNVSPQQITSQQLNEFSRHLPTAVKRLGKIHQGLAELAGSGYRPEQHIRIHVPNIPNFSALTFQPRHESESVPENTAQNNQSLRPMPITHTVSASPVNPQGLRETREHGRLRERQQQRKRTERILHPTSQGRQQSQPSESIPTTPVIKQTPSPVSQTKSQNTATPPTTVADWHQRLAGNNEGRKPSPAHVPSTPKETQKTDLKPVIPTSPQRPQPRPLQTQPVTKQKEKQTSSQRIQTNQPSGFRSFSEQATAFQKSLATQQSQALKSPSLFKRATSPVTSLVNTLSLIGRPLAHNSITHQAAQPEENGMKNEINQTQKRAKQLFSAYPSLKKIKTLQEFNEWLTEHPHGSDLTEADWEVIDPNSLNAKKQDEGVGAVSTEAQGTRPGIFKSLLAVAGLFRKSAITGRIVERNKKTKAETGLPNAHIVIVNTEHGHQHTLTSDFYGNFHSGPLSLGVYSITVHHPYRKTWPQTKHTRLIGFTVWYKFVFTYNPQKKEEKDTEKEQKKKPNRLRRGLDRVQNWVNEKRQQLRDFRDKQWEKIRNRFRTRLDKRFAKSTGYRLRQTTRFISPHIRRFAYRSTKALTRLASRAGGQLFHSIIRVGGNIGRKLFVRGAVAVAASPVGWVLATIIAVTFLLMVVVIFWFWFMTDGGEDSLPPFIPPVTTPQQLAIEKIGQESVANDATITYTITVTGNSSEPFRVIDTIFGDVSYVSATPEPADIVESDGKLKSVTWQFTNANSSSQQLGNTSARSQSVAIDKYFSSPYNLPSPTGASDVNFTDEQMNNANTLGAAVEQIQPYLLTKYDAKYVDPFLSVMWTMAIEGSGADPYTWNCNDERGRQGKEGIAKGCSEWFSSGDWQVGYAVQVSQAAGHLAEDFREIYGTTDATKVQEIGNRVIQNGDVTNPAFFPSSFPAKSVEQLVREAGSPGQQDTPSNPSTEQQIARHAIALLLMDPALGAVSVALEVAADINAQDNWALTMQSWGSPHYSNGLNPSNPLFSNRIQLLAELYTGEGGAIPPPSDSQPPSTGDITITLTVRPLIEDNYIYNIANISN